MKNLWSSKSQEGISIITFLFFWLCFYKLLQATFFVTIALTSKIYNLIDFTIEKLFYFMFFSIWFDWNVKYKIFLLINYSWKKELFYISDAIHSNNISEILILFEYFRNMYPCRKRLKKFVKRYTVPLPRLSYMHCPWRSLLTDLAIVQLTDISGCGPNEFFIKSVKKSKYISLRKNIIKSNKFLLFLNKLILYL